MKIPYQKILDWCIVKYGKSKYYDDYPDLEISKSKSSDYTGEFESDECLITIYYDIIKLEDNIYESAIKTMIHEYVHYLQESELTGAHNSKTKSSIWPFNSGIVILDYYDNPYEKEAEDVAERDWRECYIDLFGEKDDSIHR